jgi:ATP-dependent protease ClpP protease subunit
VSVDLAKLTALAGAVRDKQQAHPRPAATRKPWAIRNVSADTAEVYIYDLIGDWGVSAQDFVNELNAVRVPNLDVRVNSEGGKVFDGVAMYEALKRHPANTTGYVDGLAASAASFILMACDTVKVAKTGRLMIHDAGIGGLYVEGNAREIRESVKEILDFADLLDSLSDTIAGIYADRAGGTVAQWRASMSTDKWYTADEAVAAGLADGIVGDDTDTPTVGGTTDTTARWDPRAFADITKGVFA